jgi:transcriptional regulator of met regulon
LCPDPKDAPKPILAAKGKVVYARHLRRHIRSKHTKIPGVRLLRVLTMQQAQAHADNLRFDTKSQLICKGSALVRFEYLK